MTCENTIKCTKMADFLLGFGYGAKRLFFSYGHATRVYLFTYLQVKSDGPYDRPGCFYMAENKALHLFFLFFFY